MPVSPPVIKTTWVFIEFLLETLHGQFLGLLIEQTITFAVAPSSVSRTKDHQLPCSPMGNAYCSCDSDSLFIERIIRVAASVESVERVTIVSIQRQPEPDTLWQIGIRDEIPSKGDQIRIALSNSSLGSVRFKTPSRNNRSREYLAQPRGRNVPLALGDQHVPFDTWFDDVQVSESKVVQLLCHVVKQRGRVAIRYSIPSSARRDAHRDTVAAPHRNQCFHHFKQEAGSIFDRTTIHIGSLVDAILQKLIRQVAVTRVKLNAIKTGGLCSLGRFAIILDDSRDFSDVKRPVRRVREPTMRRRLFYRWILPIFGVDLRADRRVALLRVHMRTTPPMPHLVAHLPTLPLH